MFCYMRQATGGTTTEPPLSLNFYLGEPQWLESDMKRQSWVRKKLSIRGDVLVQSEVWAELQQDGLTETPRGIYFIYPKSLLDDP